MPFAPAPSSRSCVICRGKRVCDFFLQVCPICALGAHLLFRRIAIAAGEPRARPKRLQRVTRPSARVWRRDLRRHATGAGVLPHTPHTLLPHADSACPMLTLCSACRRTMRGRIFESKNMAHIGVGSAIRACDSPAGRGCAREAGARARARSVFQRCSARMAQRCRAACFRLVARVGGRYCMQHWLVHVVWCL